MKVNKWLSLNTTSLLGKTIAVTGTTGGLGKEICKYLASLNANLILMDRNKKRSENFKNELLTLYPSITVKCINIDLVEFDSVKNATNQLLLEDIDIFIHNAGAYSIPRCITSIGYDNVFQINFISPYYIINKILPKLREKNGKVVVVGSIAHNYSKINLNDIDFRNHKKASRVYGNAKRFLMFSLYELFKNETKVGLSITHPGITFTNITAHYPKLIYMIIKNPMKIIFMKPSKASLSIIKGVFENTSYHTWFGPKLFNIWGMPKHQKLKTCSINESNKIDELSKSIFFEINKL